MARVNQNGITMDKKFTTQFETIVRGVVLTIEAYALADHEGVFQLGITGAYAGSSHDVLALLSDDDIMQLESEALQAFQNDADDAAYWA